MSAEEREVNRATQDLKKLVDNHIETFGATDPPEVKPPPIHIGGNAAGYTYTKPETRPPRTDNMSEVKLFLGFHLTQVETSIREMWQLLDKMK
jgi:hypothetical protein